MCFHKANWTPVLVAGLGYSNLDVRSFSDPGLSYKAFNRSLWEYQFKTGISIDILSASKLLLKEFTVQLLAIKLMMGIMIGITLSGVAGEVN